jgi:hypothetical protein
MRLNCLSASPGAAQSQILKIQHTACPGCYPTLTFAQFSPANPVHTSLAGRTEAAAGARSAGAQHAQSACAHRLSHVNGSGVRPPFVVAKGGYRAHAAAGAGLAAAPQTRCYAAGSRRPPQTGDHPMGCAPLTRPLCMSCVNAPIS